MKRATNEFELLTAQQCAQRLAVHRATVTRWVRDGVLPAWRIGGVIRIRWEDVLRIAASEPASAANTTTGTENEGAETQP